MNEIKHNDLISPYRKMISRDTAFNSRVFQTLDELDKYPKKSVRYESRGDQDYIIVNHDGTISRCSRVATINCLPFYVPADEWVDLPGPVYDIIEESDHMTRQTHDDVHKANLAKLEVLNRIR